MSAFFVSRATIHDTVYLWDAVFPWGKGRPNGRTQADLDSLGRGLWRMNAAAMVARYPSIAGTPEEAEYFRAAKFYVFRTPLVSTGQLALSARCLRYQCTEGDIPERSPLYKHLNELCETIGEPKGFDAAIWDRVGD